MKIILIGTFIFEGLELFEKIYEKKLLHTHISFVCEISMIQLFYNHYELTILMFWPNASTHKFKFNFLHFFFLPEIETSKAKS